MVHITTFAGELFVFNAEGCGKSICKPRWSAKIGKHSAATPLVSNGVLYVGADSEYFTHKHPVKGYLYAFKADGCGQKSCKPLWTGHTAAGIFNTAPVLQNGTVYIVAQDALYAFDADGCGASDCAPLWRGIDTHAQGDIPYFNGSPAVGYGYIYVNEEEGFDIFPVDGCGQPQCDTVGHLFGDGLQGASASPTLANGLVFAANDQGYLHVWNAKPCGDVDCFSLAAIFITGYIGEPTSAAIVNGTIYIGGQNELSGPPGRIFALKLRQ
jgi:outer membrane protein assembly factor BamB